MGAKLFSLYSNGGFRYIPIVNKEDGFSIFIQISGNRLFCRRDDDEWSSSDIIDMSTLSNEMYHNIISFVFSNIENKLTRL